MFNFSSTIHKNTLPSPTKPSESAEIWLFGNPDLPVDALPIKLLPKLKAAFPAVQFSVQDPLDEWEIPPSLTIIDTVQGLEHVQVFDSLDAFQQDRRVTMHDFDLGMQLQFLKKLGKLPSLRIIGVPPTLSEDEAFTQITAVLRHLGSSS